MACRTFLRDSSILTLVFSALHVKISLRDGWTGERCPYQEAVHRRIVCPRRPCRPPTLKIRMNWLNILLYIPHCRYGVPRTLAGSTAKLISESLPRRSLLYNALFYLSHCDVSLFRKAMSPNSSCAALLALFSSFLKLTHRIGTAQVALVTSMPCLVRLFGSVCI